MIKYNRIFYLLLACFSSLMVYAQTSNFFTTDRELSNSLINYIYQDKRNYIWIATEDGLNRFDGVRFKQYRSQKNNPVALKNNYVHTLLEDSKGYFWVGCINGLLRYSRETDSFREVTFSDKGKVLEPDITSIVESNNGDIWMATSGNGVLRIHASNHSCEVESELSRHLSSMILSGVYQDRYQDLWFLSFDQGLNRYNPKTGKVTIYKSPQKIGSDQISAICEDSRGNLFVGTLSSGLYKLNRLTDRFDPIPYSAGKASLPIKCLTLDDRKQLLVGTDGKGMKVYNPDRNQLDDFRTESLLPGLSRSKVHSLLADRGGNLWIGIFQKGVFLNTHNTNRFTVWGSKSFSNNLIGSNCVMSLLVDKNRTMWVGTDNDGLYGVKADKSVRHYGATDTGSNVSATITSLYQDSNGTLWLGSYLQGLASFDIRSGNCHYYNQIPPALGNNFAGNKILCITEDQHKTLWIGTNGAGVYSFDLVTRTYKNHYSLLSGKGCRILNDGVNCLLYDHEGYIWVGTFRGLSKINPVTQTVENFTIDSKIFPGNVIYSLAEDKKGNIWIGTDEGLAKYNPLKRTTKYYSTANGLASNVICSIQDDDAGNIWLSTHYGISKLIVKENRFINHYAFDGLQGNEFSRGASCQSDTGELFFGGVGGVTSFNPQNITDSNHKLQLYLTALDILDVPVVAGQKSGNHVIIDRFISDVKTIRLGANDNMFSMEFSTFSFGNAERIYYRYKMEGLNSQWFNTAPGNNKISFTNLDYGSYKLRVVACDNNITSQELVLRIIIFPPWYLSPIAKMLYFIFLVILVFAIYRYIIERIEHRQEMLRREHLEQVNEGKLQFFINISHEIRTPMTLIMSPLEKLMKDKSDPERTQTYHLMYRNAQRILRLINQLLDLRKIDKGLMFVKMREFDLILFINDIIKTFEYQSVRKGINLEFQHSMSQLMVWIDLHNFDIVLVNILSNAFKFTPQGGKITIRASVGTDTTRTGPLRDYFEIVVTDTGVGIEEDKIEKIFERFYQIDNNQNAINYGTGIGLHLSKNLVELQHGIIFARNNAEGAGSEFVIQLPLGHTHLKESEKELTEEAKATRTENDMFQEDLPVEQPTEGKKVKPKTKYKILIVDDEPEIRSYLRHNLNEYWHVSECVNGKEALDYILLNKPDLVISDVMMPEMDGITLCKKLKSNININHIPLILLTAKSEDEDKAQGFEIGADAYVAKPFSIDLLIKRISNILDNRERLSHKAVNNEENQALIKPVVLKSSDQVLLEKILKIINDNLADPELNVEMLAEGVGMSRVHMHRKLKELTNMPARDFIRSIRLKQAADLLKNQKLTVSEVAYALGFSNLSHFSNSFREFYGLSPKEYAQEGRNDIRLPGDER